MEVHEHNTRKLIQQTKMLKTKKSGHTLCDYNILLIIEHLDFLIENAGTCQTNLLGS